MRHSDENSLTVEKLSIIVPAFNEQETIRSTVSALNDTLVTFVPNIQWVFVNDGSTDNTSKLMHALCSKYADAEVVEHEINRGLGSSVLSGIKASTNDWVLWIPADGQMPPAAIVDLVRNEQATDLVLLLREEQSREANRRIVTKIFRFLIRFTTAQLPHNYSGVFLCRRQLVKDITSFVRSGVINYIVADLCITRGGTVSYVTTPILRRQTGHSKVLNPRNTVRILFELMCLRLGSTFRFRKR